MVAVIFFKVCFRNRMCMSSGGGGFCCRVCLFLTFSVFRFLPEVTIIIIHLHHYSVTTSALSLVANRQKFFGGWVRWELLWIFPTVFTTFCMGSDASNQIGYVQLSCLYAHQDGPKGMNTRQEKGLNHHYRRRPRHDHFDGSI